MKLNTKDLIGGGLLMLFAIVGLWLNALDHTLGTARRMGPGYMPMLSFGLLAILAGIVIVGGLFNGPDRLEKWTKLEIAAVPIGVVAFVISYFLAQMVGFTGWFPLGIGCFIGTLAFSVAPGWRPLGLVHSGLALFGLLLEDLGLMVAMAACVVVAALAEPQNTVKGVVGMIIFLCVLCWAVFIWYLDIRVPLWPVFLTR
jgi:hypothetical protein